MRKNLNTITVTGYVYSFGDGNGRNDLKLAVTGEKSKNPGTEYISGTVNIAVDELGLNVIPVSFTYVTGTYAKSGKSNPNFSALKKLIDENKTWVSVGKENAAKVKIDGAVGLNEFYVKENDEDRLVSTKINSGSFINFVNELPAENERATFKCDMLISRVTHVDADEERNIKEDYSTVRGAIFDFRNGILPLDFIVRNPQGMSYFESLDTDEGPVYTKVWGRINCSTTTTESKEESAFGEAAVRVFEKKVREWVITGTAKEAYEFGDEEVMTGEEVAKAMQDREINLAEMKKRAEEFKSAQATPAAAAPAPAAAKAKVAGFSF